jgi:uncharacterized protein YndB with AHSA1/START domain
MAAAAKGDTQSAGEDFVISRTVDAPRDLVWKVWTDEKHLVHWWGPKGFTVKHAKLDLRPGGTFHYRIVGPNDVEIWGKFQFREVHAPDRLVFTSSFSDEAGGITRHPMAPTWPLTMLTTVTFAETGGKTTITVRWAPLNASAEERKTFDDGRASMNAGWTGTFDVLEAYLPGASG